MPRSRRRAFQRPQHRGRCHDARFLQGQSVTGPVYIEGAEPGDALKITIDGFEPSGFGWTANIPGFGLLADQFKDPALTVWSYDRRRWPLRLFSGTAGCR
jgi:acetamidase/formamidase